MAGKPPAFQFYAKDFLTGTMEMSLLEIGAYTKLLAWSWDNGPVPTDERRRAAILGVSERSLRTIWDGMADKWAPTDAGYVNARLERQRALLAAYGQTQADRAKRRWDANKPAHSNGTTSAHATASTNGYAATVPAPCSAISDLQSPKEQDRKPLARERAVPSDFQNFWRAYPRRTGKGAALKAWNQLRPDASVLAEIFEALSWQVNQPGWLKDRGQYIPHPATWLNRRGWEDEPFHPIGPEPSQVTKTTLAADAFDLAEARLDARRADAPENRPQVVGRGATSQGR